MMSTYKSFGFCHSPHCPYSHGLLIPSFTNSVLFVVSIFLPVHKCCWICCSQSHVQIPPYFSFPPHIQIRYGLSFPLTGSCTNPARFLVPFSCTNPVRFFFPSSCTNPARFFMYKSGVVSRSLLIYKSGTVCRSLWQAHVQIQHSFLIPPHVQIRYSLFFRAVTFFICLSYLYVAICFSLHGVNYCINDTQPSPRWPFQHE